MGSNHRGQMYSHRDKAQEHRGMISASESKKLDSETVLAQLKNGSVKNSSTIRAEAKDIVHCRASGVALKASKEWRQDEPVTFCYMPDGLSTITAGFRDKAINITVEVDRDTAETIQASFENLVSEAPKQKPFGDIEHKEEEASVHPVSFSWGTHDDTDGVLMTAIPTALGVRNVNGKIHRSWSPSFATDADYSKAKERGGVLYFPEGVRGSTSNPARITGIDFCVGTLTNKPAFRNMPPVKAKAGRIITAGGPGSGPRSGRSWAREANKATRVANESGKKSDHKIAADLHAQAADAYHSEGNDWIGNDHGNLAAQHSTIASGQAAYNFVGKPVHGSERLTSDTVLAQLKASDTTANADLGTLNTAKLSGDNGTGEVTQVGRRHMAKTTHKVDGEKTTFHDSENEAVQACNDRLGIKAKQKLSTETVLAQLRQTGVPTTCN